MLFSGPNSARRPTKGEGARSAPTDFPKNQPLFSNHFRDFAPRNNCFQLPVAKVRLAAGYSGPVDIYGAVDDQIIPCEHAKRLAAALHNAKFVMIEGGHNNWSSSELVRIER